MLGQFIILIFSGVLLLLPLLFWMYVFSNFKHLGVSRKQFLFGIWAWALATLPLLYDNMFIIWERIEEIFFSLSFMSESLFGMSVFWHMWIFFLIITLFSFWIWNIFCNKIEIQKYIISFLGLLFILGVFSILMYVISLFWANNTSSIAIESGSFVFAGVIWITGYYIVISLLEEWMKYISNLSTLSKKNILSFSSMLANGAVIALGFAFFENILYSYSYIVLNGVESELLQIIFFRSLFTVALHVLCAMLISGGFYMLLTLRWKYNKAYFLFFLFTFISIISHAFFDIALTFWYVGVVFIYLFMLYLLAGYITSSE